MTALSSGTCPGCSPSSRTAGSRRRRPSTGCSARTTRCPARPSRRCATTGTPRSPAGPRRWLSDRHGAPDLPGSAGRVPRRDRAARGRAAGAGVRPLAAVPPRGAPGVHRLRGLDALRDRAGPLGLQRRPHVGGPPARGDPAGRGAVLPRRPAVRGARLRGHAEGDGLGRRLSNYGQGRRMSYSALAVAAVVAVLVVDLAVYRTRLVTRRIFWATYTIVLLFQLLMNGVLTGLDVVTYDPATIWGPRIAYAPVEDLLFRFAMVTLTLASWAAGNRRGATPRRRGFDTDTRRSSTR